MVSQNTRAMSYFDRVMQAMDGAYAMVTDAEKLILSQKIACMKVTAPPQPLSPACSSTGHHQTGWCRPVKGSLGPGRYVFNGQ